MAERYSREEFERPRPTPLDLQTFLPYACGQLQLPFSLRIQVELQGEHAPTHHTSL